MIFTGVGVAGSWNGLLVLGGSLVGLVASNTAVAAAASFRFAGSTRRVRLYPGTLRNGRCAAAIGTLFLLDRGEALLRSPSRASRRQAEFGEPDRRRFWACRCAESRYDVAQEVLASPERPLRGCRHTGGGRTLITRERPPGRGKDVHCFSGLRIAPPEGDRNTN